MALYTWKVVIHTHMHGYTTYVSLFMLFSFFYYSAKQFKLKRPPLSVDTSKIPQQYPDGHIFKVSFVDLNHPQLGIAFCTEGAL